MSVKPFLLAIGALFCIVAALPASAQDVVYKCAARRSATYSDKPCSKHIVNTDQASPPLEREDVRRRQTNQAIARAMRRLPGESAEQFQARRHRVSLLPEDRAECERLDKRIPVEQARMSNPDAVEASKGEAAFHQAGKRFTELRC